MQENDWLIFKILKWCLVRYLNPVDQRSARITKPDKDFTKMLDFKDINFFPVQIRDIHKIENQVSISISVFSYENNLCIKKILRRKTCWLIIDRTRRKTNTMFLLMISIESCMIIQYIAEENIFVAIVYMLSLQKKY